MTYRTLEIDSQRSRSSQRRRKGSNFSSLMSKGFVGIIGFCLVFLTTSISCKSTKTADSKSTMNESTTPATVVDYTGLDGCGKMLVLDDGRLLLPTDAPEVMESLHYGQQVAISFAEQEAMVSICMAEDLTASIQSIDLTEKIDLSWLDDMSAKMKIYSIYRCSDAEGEFIYCKTGKSATAFTLDGKEICETKGKAMSDCVRRFSASKQCRIKGMP